jgi:hypothetical protein
MFLLWLDASSFLLSLEREGEYLFDKLGTNMSSVVELGVN